MNLVTNIREKKFIVTVLAVILSLYVHICVNGAFHKFAFRMRCEFMVAFESINLVELHLTLYITNMVKVLSKLGINVTVKLAYEIMEKKVIIDAETV